MSATDVDRATDKITELKLGTQHKIGNILKGRRHGDITMKMKESGHTHTVPSAQIFFEVPVKN